MAEERIILTRDGYEQLTRELEESRERLAVYTEQRADVNSDNPDETPEEGARFEAITTREHWEQRVGNLQFILERAEVIDEDPDPQRIDPGDRVTVWNIRERQQLTFDLIGSAEVVYGREGVSIDSPVGQALLGRRVGDVIDVLTPDGRTRYAIRGVEPIPNEGSTEG